ncbi:nitroreductase [Chloroflexota bacterium]
MDLIEAIKTRRSIRNFKPDLVSKETLAEIIEISTRSPSAMNTQPWEFTIIAGEVMDKVRQAYIENVESKVPRNPDIPQQLFTGIYRDRQKDLAVQIFKLMNIEWGDKDKRLNWGKRGNRFFNAPAMIVISVDKTMDSLAYAIFDIGIVTQTIALTALNYGLGTCIMNDAMIYPEILRKLGGIPESKRLIIGIAIGYPDWDFPANKLRSKRESLDGLVTWRGF